MSIRVARPFSGSTQRGFTLIETMIVVAIVGILAALAVYGVRKYVIASKTSEATQMIGSIKSAQEAYRSDAFTYLDVSGTHSLADLSSFYPTTTPANRKYGWGDTTTAVGQRWRALNVAPAGAVYFTYGCAAGEATDPVADYHTTGVNMTTVTNWPTNSVGSWYVVKAVGDLDGDGVKQEWVSGSFTEQIFNNTDVE
jgi:type IV pilus assembly protein PilA